MLGKTFYSWHILNEHTDINVYLPVHVLNTRKTFILHENCLHKWAPKISLLILFVKYNNVG